MAHARYQVPKGTTDLTSLTIVDDGLLIFSEGDQEVTAGTNLSGISAGMAGIYFGEEAQIKISAANAIQADVDNAATITPVLLYESHGGQVWIRPNGGHSVVTRANHLGGGFMGFTGGGTVTTHEQSGGTSHFTGDVSLTNCYHISGDKKIKYKATAVTLLHQSGGTLLCEREVTTGLLTGGTSVFRLENTSATVPTAGTLTVVGNHRCTWQLGGITTLVVEGPSAVFDISNIKAAITIGSITVDKWALANPANKRFLSSQFVITKSATRVLADKVISIP
jgi:hypothetical protein